MSMTDMNRRRFVVAQQVDPRVKAAQERRQRELRAARASLGVNPYADVFDDAAFRAYSENMPALLPDPRFREAMWTRLETLDTEGRRQLKNDLGELTQERYETGEYIGIPTVDATGRDFVTGETLS